ncbi:MAG: dihydrofolate reductase [bacterium]
MTISFIAALGANRGIGFGNKLPWNLPDDLKRFREITRGHSVIMGRKTYESIGRLLPDRKNIIITRDAGFSVDGALVAHSIEEALKQCEGDSEVFVIGGAEIFKLALPYANKMYLTFVQAEVPADSFFPTFNIMAWKMTAEEFHPKDESHAYNFTFRIYEKTN